MNPAIAFFPLLFLVLAAEAQCVEPAEFQYRAVTQKDLEGVLAEWRNRNVEAKNVRIVFEKFTDEYRRNAELCRIHVS